MEGPWRVQRSPSPRAVIDNGRFGTRTVRFETGRLARAGGSVAAYLDDETMLLATTTASGNAKEQFDFFHSRSTSRSGCMPSACIPGSFFRREGRPRPRRSSPAASHRPPLRPRPSPRACATGPGRHHRAVAQPPTTRYDVVARSTRRAPPPRSRGCRSSGPIGGVRVALTDGQWVAFPNYSDAEHSTFDMVVAGRVVGDDVAIMMVEARATDATWNLVTNEGRRRADRGGRRAGPRAARRSSGPPSEGPGDLATRP